MPTVVFIDPHGSEHAVEAPEGRSLMQVAIDHAVPGILGDCGGVCSCATCHGYVDPAFLDRLPPRSETEVFMLEGVPDLRGKGKSWPAINQNSDFGFHEIVTEDIPALAATVKRLVRQRVLADMDLGGIIANARHVILVSDASKFERTAPVRIGHISQVQTFITDHCPSDSIRTICAEQDVRIIETAPTNGQLPAE